MSASAPEPPSLDLRRVLVVSPHVDDAVLSCGHLLARAEQALSVTVFAGVPARYPSPLEGWDRDCGIVPGDDIMAKRRGEDARTLEILGISARVLDFLDLQYRNGEKPDTKRVAGDLPTVIDEFEPTTIALPLAIQHPDHRDCLSAALASRRRGDRRDWLCYAEFPYVWRGPDLAARRLAAVRRRGFRVTPILLPSFRSDLKAEALRAYESQILGLELATDIDRVAEAPEQHWRLTDRPPFAVRAARRAGYRLGVLK
jgi:LmbE family N-acetylglucosaminyl deacetylase